MQARPYVNHLSITCVYPPRVAPKLTPQNPGFGRRVAEVSDLMSTFVDDDGIRANGSAPPPPASPFSMSSS
jgi:hypothetical protein